MSNNGCDLVGQRFGNLIVLEISPDKLQGTGRHWVCQCDCGNTCIKNSSSLNAGTGRSCGCLVKTHQMSKTRPYSIWLDMRRRCNHPYRPGYENYGGRGISYDSSWDSFEEFWCDMEYSYCDNMELERKDVNGNYCKDNCEWVLPQEQSKNKRRYTNNILGVANISVYMDRDVPTVRARIQETETKRRHVKTFSTKLYGYDCAIELAKDWIGMKRKEFGYKETHGT